jgi:ribosomal protein S18 acetylase RimI-like enzyme
VRFRFARLSDAESVARLHADSWRRHYRGAYSDAFLDGDVLADRLAAWRALLGEADPHRVTIVAEDGSLVGFAHARLRAHPRWGALLDNLHVAAEHKRRGIGSRLLALTAEGITARPGRRGLYVWVLEQNNDARAFYEASGASLTGRAKVEPPGGIAGRLSGSPAKLRYAWADPVALLGRPRKDASGTVLAPCTVADPADTVACEVRES